MISPDLMPIHKECLRKARAELCKMTDGVFTPERLNPMTEAYKEVNDIIGDIERLLGY